MKQLLLDFLIEKPQTLDSFVVGRNAELLSVLQRCAQQSAAENEHFIYIWGEAGVGKTHLLQALSSSSSFRYIAARDLQDDWVFEPEIKLYLLDDVEQLSETGQIAAFNLFNQVREQRACLISTGNIAPTGLTLREDLRTRLGWGLIYRVHGLTDDEKIAALTNAAHARGIVLSAGVLPYLITHFQRDMRSLMATLDALDRYSLEVKRPITLPLLQRLMQN